VRTKHGEIVQDLNKEDFRLAEEGHPQTIRYFSREADLPLTLGLLVDTSLSQRGVLDEERRASYGFLDQILREERDLAFVIHFDVEVELLQDLTSSRKKLETSLGQLRTPQPGFRRRDPDSPGPRTGGRRNGVGTALYDAVLLASDELMKKQSGRKALIMLSDGVDHGSKVTLTHAIEAAQRADTLVYTILFSGAAMYGGGSNPQRGSRGRRGRMPPPRTRLDGRKILERLSRETGGGFFEVTKKQSVSQIYSHIQEELRSQYSIGYTPQRTDAGPGFRKISLTTSRKGLLVRAREGYFAGQ
jgi:VWFA-related protein